MPDQTEERTGIRIGKVLRPGGAGSGAVPRKKRCPVKPGMTSPCHSLPLVVALPAVRSGLPSVILSGAKDLTEAKNPTNQMFRCAQHDRGLSPHQRTAGGRYFCNDSSNSQKIRAAKVLRLGGAEFTPLGRALACGSGGAAPRKKTNAFPASVTDTRAAKADRRAGCPKPGHRAFSR